MELELKHLAPYLPYGLKFSYFDTDRELVLNDCWIEQFHIPDEVILMNGDYEYNLLVKDLKPILHPLSDLKKHIEFNGERFIPIDRLFLDYTPTTKSVFGMFTDLQNPLEYRFDVVQKLFEWHFDVSNLIPNNLAIDINTLK